MPPKRKRSNDADGQDGQDSTRNKQFAYLKPRVRQVPEKTIRSKWTTLPEPTQEQIRDMFKSLERPVIVRQRNERKRIEAQTAVQAVIRNLAKRLPKMPFPLATRSSNFGYEAALDEHRSLEAQLAAVTDSVDVLKAEVNKEEALLAKETNQLQEMEKNAKSAESERKRQARNEHPVLRQLEETSQDVHKSDREPVEYILENEGTMLNELGDDPETMALMGQLHNHLQSMQNNTAPLSGLRDVIARTQAALDLLEVAEG